MRVCQLVTFMLFAAASSTAGCAGPAGEPLRTGRVEFALHSTAGDITYELRNATFSIAGPTELELRSDDAPDASVLEQELPVGEYAAELMPGWQLFEVAAQEETELEAVLASDNPAAFSISEQATTEVIYRFTIDGADVALASGTLRIGMEVVSAQDGADAGPKSKDSVIFTELMRDPSALADTTGEWFELRNVGAAAIDLNGCVVTRDTTAFTISEPLEVAPGGVVALARSESPGFMPSLVYTQITLPNSTSFVLSLTCGGELMDSVTVDPGPWPGGPGVAASLSSTVASAAGNDDPGAWCAATAPYATDLGTPGGENPACG